MNTEILDEYEEIISAKTTSDIARNVVETIARLSATYYQESYVHFGLIQQDEDDNKFVDCAIAADAEYIVSNDAHFNILDTIPWSKVIVIKLQEYYNKIMK